MSRAVLSALLFLLLCACTVEPPEGTEKSQTDGVPSPIDNNPVSVYTDWSKLDDRDPPPRPIGSRWYEDYIEELILRDDYGPLVPYAGLRLLDDWPAMNGCLYGLMTQDGVVVTDPVYSNVYCPCGYDEKGTPYALPLLVLEQGDEIVNVDLQNPATYAVAARNGSWCTPFDYCAYAANSHGLLLFQPDSITVMAEDGTIQKTWTVAEIGISQSIFDSMLTSLYWGDGWSGARHGNYMAIDWAPDEDYTQLLCLDLVSGNVEIFLQEEWDSIDEHLNWEEAERSVPDAELLIDRLLGPDAPGLLTKTEFAENGMIVTYYREDGTPLPQLTQYGGLWYDQVNVVGGLIEVLDQNLSSYYDLETLECVFRIYLNYEGD